jgi:peptidoglycan/xylan/chitin deacetylase (PgdA/CDA1 family)
VAAAFGELGHEIACHGWRWIHYQGVPEDVEREHLRMGMEILERITGSRALGFYVTAPRATTRFRTGEVVFRVPE